MAYIGFFYEGTKPVRLASDEFAHITIYLDVPGMPAAGYTALSRVATSDCYLFGGHVTREHLAPAM